MKKHLWLIIGAVVAVAAIVVSLVFVFTPNEDEPEVVIPDLSGNWTAVATYVGETPTLTEGQFASFKDGTAIFYKDGAAYATSAYTIDEALELALPDISRTYKLNKKTDNVVRLYSAADNYMLLVRTGAEVANNAYTAADLSGKWQIVMKGSDMNKGEALEFVDGQFKYYRAGAAEPVVAPYTWENGVIDASSLGLKMRCLYVNSTTFVLVANDGTVWELVRE